MKHTLQVLVENRFGVLARVASLFSARGYNIDSLAVGETHDPTVSCMTIVVNAEDEKILEQVKKQLHKLIDVIKVVDFTRGEYIDRELMLIKVFKRKETGKVIDELAKKYSLKVIGEDEQYFLLEICREASVVNEVLRKLKKVEIKELVRTGKVAMSK